jgi:hypothetical protein
VFGLRDEMWICYCGALFDIGGEFTPTPCDFGNINISNLVGKIVVQNLN